MERDHGESVQTPDRDRERPVRGRRRLSHLQAAEARKASAEANLARGEEQQSTIVGAYLADVAIGADGVPQPLHYREHRRTLGPSNRPDLGRQAEFEDARVAA